MGANENVVTEETRDNAALLLAGAALGDVKQHENKEFLPYAIVPPGHELKALERMETPSRKSGTVKMMDARSFGEFFKLHAEDGNALVYASLTPAQFVAVLNDHRANDDAAIGHPDWRDHRVSFQLKHSKEWNTWMARNGSEKGFGGNVDFAEWLEDQAPDVVKPEGAAMMQMALSFKATESAKFSSAARLQDGTVAFEYSSTIEGSATTAAGGKSKIPDSFTIQIPVFDGPDEPKYKIEARFRYRLSGGQLRIWYQLERPHLVMEAAFKEIWKRIEKETKASILYGLPE